MSTMHAQPHSMSAPFPALEDYLAYMEAIQGRSVLTMKEYHYDLQLFFRWLLQRRGQQSDRPLDEVDISGIDLPFVNSVRLSDCYAFLSWLVRDRQASAATRARKVAALKSFFRYLKRKRDLIDEDPTYELESPRLGKRNPRHLSLEESRGLLETIASGQTAFPARDYCIMTFFLNCGLRLSELCGINVSNIRDDTLTVIGKGNKERTIYLNAACMKALRDYLTERSAYKIKPAARDALFISRQGNRIAPATVQLLIKNWMRRSGLDIRRYSTHKLRHTAATLMYQYGHVDIRLLQQILGHASVSTTEIYTHVDDKRLHEAVEANPLADEEKGTVD